MDCNIRTATQNDMEQILIMAKCFWSYTDFEESFCAESAAKYADISLDQGLLSVIEKDGELIGMVSAIAAPLLGNAVAMLAQEICYWIDQAHRSEGLSKALLAHLEQSAKKAGVKYLTMTAIKAGTPEIAKKIYIDRGYSELETNFIKVL